MQMNGEYLLDTNIVIALFNSERDVVNRLRDRPTVFLPVAAIGELYHGAFKSEKVNQNLARIRDFISVNTVLDVSAETAYEYGSIKDQLRRKGRPIPANDLWIAATARQYQLTVATRDEHFWHVDGLDTEKW
jgi:tRNA(fMet)-specific endonuclease VapC